LHLRRSFRLTFDLRRRSTFRPASDQLPTLIGLCVFQLRPPTSLRLASAADSLDSAFQPASSLRLRPAFQLYRPTYRWLAPPIRLPALPSNPTPDSLSDIASSSFAYLKQRPTCAEHCILALPSSLLPACAFCRPSGFTFRLTVDSRRPSVFQLCLPSNFRLSSKSDSQRSFGLTFDLRRRSFFRPAFEPISDFRRISHSWTSPSDPPPACAGCQPSKLCLPTDPWLAPPICLPALPSCLPPTCAGCRPSSSVPESTSVDLHRGLCCVGRKQMHDPRRRRSCIVRHGVVGFDLDASARVE